ncbi:MAG: glycosyltransferase [Anaerolineae bacterium]
MIKISAVVVTKDRYNLLKDCLSTILTEGAEWISNIIVVDNASSDDTAKLEGDVDGRLTVIHLPNNIGAERGVAVGIQAALKTDVDAVLLFDDDSQFLPGSIKSLVESFLLHDKRAVINALPLSDLSGTLSSPRLCGGRFVHSKEDLLVGNGGQRYVRANKVHFNGSLLGRGILERCKFTGVFGEEAYGALLQQAGYDLVIDTNANILHPSFVEKDGVRVVTLPLIGPVVVWQLRPRKAYIATKESVLKRRILHHPLRFLSLDLLVVVGAYLVRIIFEKDRLKKLPFYVRGLLDGLWAALRFRREEACSGDSK